MNIAYLSYITEKKFNAKYAEKLRGYFANLYKEEDLFHNHDENSKSIYRMPYIQYKIINGNLMIMGIEKGAKIVAVEFLKHDRIILENEIFENFEKQLKTEEFEMKVDDELYKYRFETIWLPLNQKNHKLYQNGELDMNRVLTNNILSNFKGCSIVADKKIMVKGNYKEKIIGMKNNSMIGFTGDFVSNVRMPDYISVGKRRAIGYGVVVGVS